MRFVAMQLLTWGTIAGAIGSALLLAGLERPADKHLAAWPLAVALPLPGEPSQPVHRGGQPARATSADSPPSAPNSPNGPGLQRP